MKKKNRCRVRRLCLETLENRFALTPLVPTAEVPPENVALAVPPFVVEHNDQQRNLFRIDADGNGALTALDVLTRIEALNSIGPTALVNSYEAGLLDVNGDGLLSPLDVVMTINRINQYNVGKIEDTHWVYSTSTEKATTDIVVAPNTKNVVLSEVEVRTAEIAFVDVVHSYTSWNGGDTDRLMPARLLADINNDGTEEVLATINRIGGFTEFSDYTGDLIPISPNLSLTFRIIGDVNGEWDQSFARIVSFHPALITYNGGHVITTTIGEAHKITITEPRPIVTDFLPRNIRMGGGEQILAEFEYRGPQTESLNQFFQLHVRGGSQWTGVNLNRIFSNPVIVNMTTGEEFRPSITPGTETNWWTNTDYYDTWQITLRDVQERSVWQLRGTIIVTFMAEEFLYGHDGRIEFINPNASEVTGFGIWSQLAR